MSKRTSSGDIKSAFTCKPCQLTYDTQAQLIRHKNDRHGPQVVCTLCKNSFLLPQVRTDVQRRHLVSKHKFLSTISVNEVRQIFNPYFEECDTPALDVPLRSTVSIPQRVPPTTSSLPEIPAHLSPTLPASNYEDPLLDDTTVPDNLEAFLTEAATPETTKNITTTPDHNPSTPELQYNTPSRTTLPNLSLDWTFPNPQLSLPIRYESPLQILNIEPDDFNTSENTCTRSPHQSTPPPERTPSEPSINTPEFNMTQIPLEPHHTDSQIHTATSYPPPRKDTTTVISGVDSQHTPEFPPRRIKVPSRKQLDPRLLFRDAPSDFLAGSMARLAAYQRRDIIRQATSDNTHVSFEQQLFTITRHEQIQLSDGRVLTMKTSCTLDDNLKISRGAQTQTE